MPYDGEFAGYRPLQRIVETERVQNLLRKSRVFQPNTTNTVSPKQPRQRYMSFQVTSSRLTGATRRSPYATVILEPKLAIALLQACFSTLRRCLGSTGRALLIRCSLERLKKPQLWMPRCQAATSSRVHILRRAIRSVKVCTKFFMMLSLIKKMEGAFSTPTKRFSRSSHRGDNKSAHIPTMGVLSMWTFQPV